MAAQAAFDADRLRRLHKETGITWERLAEASGLSLPAMYKLASGKHPQARVGTVAALAGVLKVPFDGLVRGDGLHDFDTVLVADDYTRLSKQNKAKARAFIKALVEAGEGGQA